MSAFFNAINNVTRMFEASSTKIIENIDVLTIILTVAERPKRQNSL